MVEMMTSFSKEIRQLDSKTFQHFYCDDDALDKTCFFLFDGSCESIGIICSKLVSISLEYCKEEGIELETSSNNGKSNIKPNWTSERSNHSNLFFPHLTKRMTEVYEKQHAPYPISCSSERYEYTPLYQCLHACDYFKNYITLNSDQDCSGVFEQLASVFKLINPSEKLNRWSYLKMVENSEKRQSILQKMLHVELDLFQKDEVALRDMSFPLFLDILLSKLYLIHQNFGNTTEPPYLQSYFETKVCDRCEYSVNFSNLGSKLMLTLEIDADMAFLDQIDKIFHFYPVGDNSAREKCQCANPIPQKKQLYDKNTRLRIISLSNPNEYRVTIPSELEILGKKLTLKAFFGKKGRDLYSCVNYDSRWYFIYDLLTFEISDIEYFLRKGNQIMICFYEISE